MGNPLISFKKYAEEFREKYALLSYRINVYMRVCV